MIELEKFRRMVNFDLDTTELKKIFKDTRKPYNDLRNFFEKHGFEHSQYLGYTSKQELSYSQILLIMKQLKREFSWIKQCLQDLSVTIVTDTSNFTNYLTDNISKQEYKLTSQDDRLALLQQALDENKNDNYKEKMSEIYDQIHSRCRVDNSQELFKNRFQTHKI